MRRPTLAVLAGLALLGSPPAASAHHSFAMYDATRTVTLRGAVKTFMWTNPHVVIWLVGAPVSGGTPATWTIELTSPGNLTRIGWSRTSLKPGDDVEVQILPLRDGESGGELKSVTVLATGQVLSGSWVQATNPAARP